MNKTFFLPIIFLLLSLSAKSQGVSASFIIPKNGYVSVPVSPLSVRGLGLSFGILGIETGASLYNMPGLPMTGLPFDADEPLTGPHWSIIVPLQLSLTFDADAMSVKFLGGGFGMGHIAPRINYGNMDRAIRDFENWDVTNADLEVENKLGFGWMAGVELAFHVNKNFSITTEVQYLKGDSGAAITGAYSGGSIGGNIETRSVAYPDAVTALEGVEISIGVKMNK
ncbi:hypothetical protein N7E81_04425 [Reichenbachiella carrageenanivorans]|uniref:Outer membrane protein beta-barrel domain-containing protein n=1 Tax=Reichenbachiella carrageenanivorans TaxID=2979869 RepID=A0ABY6D5F2_9BACT|nr:hypothetical protein [Reichenbachiella carrageenanivorans]UXX80343.1 hypothetical protein N7E81_04425 [Reichenbachiella carrageenanivorans]